LLALSGSFSISFLGFISSGSFWGLVQWFCNLLLHRGNQFSEVDVEEPIHLVVVPESRHLLLDLEWNLMT
jgi:hypothetical protein